MNSRLRVVLLCCSIAIIASCTSTSSPIIPKWTLEVDYYELENGLSIIQNSTNTAGYFELRFDVAYGFSHETCLERERPHYLEHLLFLGTSKHSGSELESIASEAGIIWNATTTNHKTTYEITAPAEAFDVAIDLVDEILFESTLSEELIKDAKTALFVESGGRIKAGETKTPLKDLSYIKLAAIDAGTNCREYLNADNITAESIHDAYKNYYTPSNMNLLLVGSLPRDAKYTVQKVFNKRSGGKAKIPKINQTFDLVKDHYQNDLRISEDVTLTAGIGFFSKSDGQPEQLEAIDILNNYLDVRLFDDLRGGLGIAYSPGSASIFEYGNVILLIGTDLLYEDKEKATEYMQALTDELKADGISKEEFIKAKNRSIKAFAFQDNTNTDLIDFYHYYPNYFDKENSRYVDYSELLKNMTYEDFRKHIAPLFNGKSFTFLDGADPEV
jgi:predicted Zn-dependent peptidase